MKSFLLIIVMILFSAALAVAQPILPPEPEPVPITGIELLLVGGGAYGIYRLKKKNKNNEA